MARIAIDCRKIGDFGIGVWIRSLLTGLVEIDSPHQFLVLGPHHLKDDVPGDSRFVHVPLESPHYSFRELVVVGRTAEKHGAGLLHSPHYVVPMTRLPVVTTVHDLIHLRVPGLSIHARTYARVMLRRAVLSSERVLVPTEAVANEIVRRWPKARKPIVTGCGIDPLLERTEAGERIPGLQPRRYFLYVGNDKPHKNVQRLVEAFRPIHRRHPETLLVLVGGDFRRFDDPGIVHPGFVTPGTLRTLYEQALAVVQPSLFEGFGLPVLEAMWFGTPVAIASIPPLLEVAGDAGLTFDPESVRSIEDTLAQLVNSSDLRRHMAEASRSQAARYTRAGQASKVSEAWGEVLS
ncbi:MAG: glycosyltransferase family 4 protein [Acidobacteria bacterium]|nr:glycosyltransferase family 4 protein [Acidobacteriota bacterium]